MESYFDNILDLAEAIIIITDDCLGGYIEYIEYMHYLNEFERYNSELLYKESKINHELAEMIGTRRLEMLIDALA